MSSPVVLSDVSKSELASKLERYRNAIKGMKAHTQRATRLGADALLTVAGGAAAGALAVKLPMFPGTQINTDLVVGSLLCLAAMADMADGYDAELNAFGSGLLAAATAREVQT